ncbi:MAG: hypothetical protein DRR19_10055 [Candidatus Parabeggiatoa sp. nov. 1]|nr:MAG: hypothetical protein DRR19_10055 [Gammaproteobacteria bacterium]
MASLKAKPRIILAHVFLKDGKLFASYFRGQKPKKTSDFDEELRPDPEGFDEGPEGLDVELRSGPEGFSEGLRSEPEGFDEGPEGLDVELRSEPEGFDNEEQKSFDDEQNEAEESPTLMDYYFSNPEVQGNDKIEDNYFFKEDYVEVFKEIIYKGKPLGTIYIRSDLKELNERLLLAGCIIVAVLIGALLLGFVLASKLQRLITTPLYSLLSTMKIVSVEKNYSIREPKPGNDELGSLVEGFNDMLAQVEGRDKELALANQEITALNELLKEDNLRMSAELEVTRQLQQMVLPKEDELQQIEGLDIAGFMEPAEEVGGDYYDVLQHNGHVKIGIGDVTGHGLESGVLMLMVQMAVRTLLINDVSDSETFLSVLNRAVFDNARRIQTDKNLTLSLLDYEAGTLRLTGQHEDVLLVRKDGNVELIDTFELGFMVGVKPDISAMVSQMEIQLQPGDGIVLYTDGITEAQNMDEEQYGIERLCEVVSHNWQQSALGIQQAIVADVRQYISEQKVFDDITVLVLKQLA